MKQRNIKIGNNTMECSVRKLQQNKAENVSIYWLELSLSHVIYILKNIRESEIYGLWKVFKIGY